MEVLVLVSQFHCWEQLKFSVLAALGQADIPAFVWAPNSVVSHAFWIPCPYLLALITIFFFHVSCLLGVCWETLPSWLSLPQMKRLVVFWHKLSPLHLQQPQVHPQQAGNPWRQDRTRQIQLDLLWISLVGQQGLGSGAVVAAAAAVGVISLALHCGGPQTILQACGGSQA